MKKCPWCGREYPDEASVCAVDQYSLDPPLDPLVVEEAEARAAAAFAAMPKWQRLLRLSLLYLAALAISWVTGYLVILGEVVLYQSLFPARPTVPDILIAVTVGAASFCGVLVGARCVPRSHRVFVSGLLLLSAVACFFFLNSDIDPEQDDEPLSWLWLIPPFAGGLPALFWHWFRTRRKFPEPALVAEPK